MFKKLNIHTEASNQNVLELKPPKIRNLDSEHNFEIFVNLRLDLKSKKIKHKRRPQITKISKKNPGDLQFQIQF